MVSNKELIERAHQALTFAYAPYSHFQVGAAVLMEDGAVFTGCNIENASFGATNCAERTAIFKAVSEGHRSLNKVAIVSSSNKKTPPCGICLQVMSEFITDHTTILLEEENQIYEYRYTDFLPNAFQLEHELNHSLNH